MKKLFLLLLFLLPLIINAQDYALAQLENSPRHHEWVSIPSGSRTIKAFVAYPEVSNKAQTIIVIHENRGLTDWVRSFADQLAAAGYIALAPDLLSDFRDGIRTTADFNNSDEAREAIYQLDPDQVTSDLNEAFKYLKSLAAGNGDVSVIGFCWGGGQSFRYATNQPELKTALVFYGSGPSEASSYASVKAPVYGFYGENDQRVNASIEASKSAMDSYGNTYKYVIYEGAGHAYMRSGDDPEGSEANKKAKIASTERIIKILNK